MFIQITHVYVLLGFPKCPSKRSAIDMLTEKNNQKVEVKKEELALRRMELDFQKEKYAAEADERKTKLEMECKKGGQFSVS